MKIHPAAVGGYMWTDRHREINGSIFATFGCECTKNQ